MDCPFLQSVKEGRKSLLNRLRRTLPLAKGKGIKGIAPYLIRGNFSKKRLNVIV